MQELPEIEDDETVLRHIPGGEPWLQPGPRITSANFGLRPGEEGVSVTRQSVRLPDELLEQVDSTPQSRIAAARVGDIRELGFRVVPNPIPEDTGHALIKTDRASLSNRADRRKLKLLFRLAPQEGVG